MAEIQLFVKHKHGVRSQRLKTCRFKTEGFERSIFVVASKSQVVLSSVFPSLWQQQNCEYKAFHVARFYSQNLTLQIEHYLLSRRL